MNTTVEDFSKALEKARVQIQLITSAVSREMQSGIHLSEKKGSSGFEISGFRKYCPGDDVRLINWKITARTGDMTIKVPEEERTIPMVLLVDLSDSVRWQSGRAGKSKGDVVFEICTLFSLAAISQGDAIGALILSRDGPHRFYPERTEEAAMAFLRTIFCQSQGVIRGTDKKCEIDFLEYTPSFFHGPGLILIISDFLFPLDRVKGHLRKIKSYGNDVVVIVVRDPVEMEFPDLGKGRFIFTDFETGEELFLDQKGIKQLQVEVHSNVSNLRKIFRNSGAEFLFLKTNEDFLRKILLLFLERQGK